MADRPWWKEGVIYQIYPRSFADSNGDGVGDLRGIISKLDHLRGGEGSLGVDAIWLSPFYPSPMADFGYDVSDFTGVHELFGTMDDFDALVAEAHGRGMRVVIDWVPNHTSDRHPWFVASSSSRDDPKRDWYVWRDPADDGGPPNNWSSAFSAVGPAWTLDEATSQYYLHSFMAEQPELNWDNPEVEAAMHDTLRFWLDRGVDGFRIDVAHKIGKDPELSDNPADIDESTAHEPERRHDEDWDSGHERLRSIRKLVDEYDDRMIVGEVYLLDQQTLSDYINTGDELNLAHNFVFLHQPWNASAFRDTVEQLEGLITPLAWPAWFLNNHDHSRVATRYAEAGNGAARARTAALMTLTLRGTVFLFQGEELGLEDVEVPSDQVVDVDGRDPERCPIPWEPPSAAGAGAGFSNGEPWLPMTTDAERVNARVQSEDPGSTLSFYRRLIAYRKATPALQMGSWRAVAAGDDIFAYVREAGGERLLIALNFTSEVAHLDGRPAGLDGAARAELSTDPGRDGDEILLHDIELRPDEGVVIRLP